MQFCCPEHKNRYYTWRQTLLRYVNAGAVSHKEARLRLDFGRKFGVLPLTRERSALFSNLRGVLFSEKNLVSPFTVSDSGEIVLLRTCKTCGAEFEAGTVRTEFCSDECWYAWWNNERMRT